MKDILQSTVWDSRILFSAPMPVVGMELLFFFPTGRESVLVLWLTPPIIPATR